MNKIEKVFYTGNAHTIVDHDPYAQRGEHGTVDIKTSTPGGQNLNFIAVEPHPTAEQLFAGAWSACYITALGLAASLKKVELPRDTSVDVEVGLGQSTSGWQLGAKFSVRLPGLDLALAEAIVHSAHQICPYSKAMSGNIDVAVDVVTD